jgi:hypothetical protein
MPTVLILLSWGSKLLPYVAALFSPTIWAIVSRALPLVTQLVKEYESDKSIVGREKAILVIRRVQVLLAEEGFLVNPSFDWILSALVEMSLIYLRHGEVEKQKSKVITRIRLV